jgi:hypothetical protein
MPGCGGSRGMRRIGIGVSFGDNPYLVAFRGSFRGVLRWQQLNQLWLNLRRCAAASWYVYAVGKAVPSTPVSAAELENFIGAIDRFLRREHTEDYCGIVYADNIEAPSLVKIFDPNSLGSVCGFSERPTLPGWVLSTLPPVGLPAAFGPAVSRRRWWRLPGRAE